ncbi:MAG: hypothetical protein ACXVBW_05015, partial [Bdellovibrionota bacterium]
HWYQIKLYEALMSPNQGDRDRAVAGTITGFRNLVSNLPDSADFDMMPETSKEAPIFAKLFPGLPPTFDNLHSLHDVLSDILVSDKVSTEQVVPEAFRFGRMAQDPKAFAAAQCPGRQEK